MILQIIFFIVILYLIVGVFRFELMGMNLYPTSLDQSEKIIPASIGAPFQRSLYSADLMLKQSPFRVYCRNCEGTVLDLRGLTSLNADVVLLQQFKISKFKIHKERCQFITATESESDFHWLLSSQKGMVLCAIGIQARQPIVVQKYAQHDIGNNVSLSVLVHIKRKPFVFSSSLLTDRIDLLRNVDQMKEEDSKFIGHILSVHLMPPTDSSSGGDVKTAKALMDSSKIKEEMTTYATELPYSKQITTNSDNDIIIVDIAHKSDQMNDTIAKGSLGTMITFYTAATAYIPTEPTYDPNANLLESFSRAVHLET